MRKKMIKWKENELRLHRKSEDMLRLYENKRKS